MRSHRITVRLTDDEYEQLHKKASDSNMNQSRFVVNAIMNKQIIMIDGLKEYRRELRKIGNNLNQLTTLCHMGKIKCLNLDAAQKALTENWKSVRLLQKGLREDGMKSGGD